MEELFQRLADAGLIDIDDSIILKFNDDGSTSGVTKEVFLTFFGDVAANPTYEALCGPHTFMWGDPPTQMSYTGVQLGYKEHFDSWKAQGIL